MSANRKRSIRIAGKQTSICLEDEFWQLLRRIARERDTTVNKLVARIDRERGEGNRSSAIRVYVLAQRSEGVAA